MKSHMQEITDERRNQRVSNFTLPATNGTEVTLYKFAAKKRPLLFFPVSADDEPSKLFSRNLASFRDELVESDAVFLPILKVDTETARLWAEENAKGYPALIDADGSIRKKFFEYFEVDPAQALFVLLNIYITPVVIAHSTNALELLPPAEMQKWLNVLAAMCSE